MSVLNLRNVPEGLMHKLHEAAARAGRERHFHEFCVELLQLAVEKSNTRFLPIKPHEYIQVPHQGAEWRRQMGIGTVEASGKSSTLQNRAQNIPEIISDAPADEPLETRIT